MYTTHKVTSDVQAWIRRQVKEHALITGDAHRPEAGAGAQAQAKAQAKAVLTTFAYVIRGRTVVLFLVVFFWVVFFLISLNSPYVLRAHTGHTRGEPNAIELINAHGLFGRYLSGTWHTRPCTGRSRSRSGACREPFNTTPMGVTSSTFGPPQVRPMGLTYVCWA